MQQPLGPPDPESLSAGQRARRDKIVRAALKALSNGDHETMRITEVAQDAGVALGTLYRYFSSKEHLVAAAFYEWIHILQERMAAAPPQKGTEQERLTSFYHQVLRAFEVQPQFFRAMLMIESTNDPYAAQIFASLDPMFRKTVSYCFDGPLEGWCNDVFRVMSAVLNASLRSWTAGRGSVQSARADIDAALNLIYTAPPN
jgi:AcrR family transcriptional regulator